MDGYLDRQQHYVSYKELQMICVKTIELATDRTNGFITGRLHKHKQTHRGNTHKVDQCVC